MGLELLGPSQTDAVLVENDPRARHHRGMIGELTRRVEILVESGGTQEEHVARVRKSLPSPAVGLEFFREPVVAPGEVADRSIVFRVGKTAHRHRSRIAGVRLGKRVKFAGDPCGDRGFLGLLKRFRFSRRHFPALDRFEDAVPEFELLVESRIGRERFHIDLALDVLATVAAVAFGREDGFDRLPIRRGKSEQRKRRKKRKEDRKGGTTHGGGHEDATLRGNVRFKVVAKNAFSKHASRRDGVTSNPVQGTIRESHADAAVSTCALKFSQDRMKLRGASRCESFFPLFRPCSS